MVGFVCKAMSTGQVFFIHKVEEKLLIFFF